METLGEETAKRLGHGATIGEKNMNPDSIRNHNERLFVVISIVNIQAQVVETMVRDRKEKWIQFATLVHLFI